MLHGRTLRALATLSVGSILSLGLALPAAAHVNITSAGDVHAGAGGTISFRVGHGCGELSTDTVEVQIPDGVVGVQAQAMPGWDIETQMVDTEPYERFGETLTERVGVVRWSGGDLDTHLFEDFTIQATFPADVEELTFPTVQRCGDEELAWIEIPTAGQDAQGLDSPAPVLTLAAAEQDSNDH